MERRLAAILSADVVGYSSLMESNEVETFNALQMMRKRLLEPAISEHRGRTVKLMGDGVLVEFSSIVDAVECALTIQSELGAEKKAEPSAIDFQLRIGVHLGDVIFDENDVYGDGVNIASRLEGIARPGSVWISQQAYDQVTGRIHATFEDRGVQSLKNIARPVRAFQVSRVLTSERHHGSGDQASNWRNKPAIAVLPFTNQSGDGEQEYFAEGMTEDIITELLRFHSVNLIAKQSSFAFGNKAVDVRLIGRELGARFILDGTIRKAGNRIRVTARLVETENGEQVWGERYDRLMDDIFDLQDELVRTIVSTAGGRIEAAGKIRASRLRDISVSAYDLCLKAQHLQDSNTKESYDEAEALLRSAIEESSQYAEAYHQLSLIKFWQWMVYWSERPEETYREAVELAEKALALDPEDGLIHAHLCMLHFSKDEFDLAATHIERALRLNPNDVKVHGLYGNYLIASGEPQKAVDVLDGIRSFNPVEPPWITRLRAIALFLSGEFQEAFKLLRAFKSPPNITRAWLASAAAHAGDLEVARAALKEFLEVAEREAILAPNGGLGAWREDWRAMRFKDKSHEDLFFNGLLKASMKG
jgi:adenylate cyclase